MVCQSLSARHYLEWLIFYWTVDSDALFSRLLGYPLDLAQPSGTGTGLAPVAPRLGKRSPW